ncbi:endo-alpha-N-acetylgalactosaminidase [Streptacidiphilus sp. BW17]|uniref:endo-alpha-N-acetylgalactosaminidase family protein n=1 Tax=Streptacidiphilus sp. BW17 TaxID=3156274 RepID=UPI0035138B77
MGSGTTRLPRAVAGATAGAVLAFGLTTLTAPPSAATAPGVAIIRSGQLSATLDRAFPQAEQYQYGPAGLVYGHNGPAPQVDINGTAYTPTVTSTIAADHADYRLDFAAIDVSVKIRISVRQDVLDWKVTGVTESGTTKVSTFAVPGQSLLSVRGDQPGATLADATVYRTDYAPGPDLDTIKAVADLPVQSTPQTASIALLNTSTVAAALESNSLQSYGNLQVQTTQAGSVKQTGAWSNSWTYRGPDGKVVAPPEEKVVFTGDRNGDSTVDWQDGAIAYREIMPALTGAAETKNNVVSQIALNFESQAQNPFIKTLDDIKKVDLLTDGLGQSIELKGYQDQGHDSAHPDYAGHYNQAAGGLTDINTVVSQAKKYNTIVGVHINDAMASPRAKAFRWDDTSDTSAPSYIYGDTNYALNQTKDLASGDFGSRIDALLKDVPGLGFIYSDAFFAEDWDAWKEAATVNSHGLPIYTEFPTYMWPDVAWYHDSNEYNDVGINSQILRFIYNSDTDAWIQNSQPMLGGEQNNASFMGWHSANSVNKEITQVFTNNLPTKYLQNFQITRWQPNEIDFTGGVKTTMSGSTPQIWKDGALERDGDNLFLPWSAQGEEKIYTYSDSSAARTWTLPRAWADQHEVTLYKLTDTGKTQATTVPVHDGKVTITIAADTPYVVYPQHPITPQQTTATDSDGSNTGTPVLTHDTAQNVDFGAGTPVKDGEFFSHSFDAWRPSSSTGDTSGVQIVTDSNGFQNLKVSGPKDGQVSQQVNDLQPGQTYAASAYVNVTGNRKATLQVSDYGGPTVQQWIDAPPPVQNDQDNRLAGQRFQRIDVLFTMPQRGHTSARLSLIGGAGTGSDAVQFTDVRIQTDPGGNDQTGGHYATEDFEHPIGGSFGPFIIGQSSEPSEILSENNPGYTRDTISGTYSLETINNGAGLQFRTWPGTLRLQPNHVYRVRMDYQSDTSGLYDFQVDTDGVTTPIVDLPLAQTTDRGLTSSPPPGPSPKGWTDSLPPQYSAPHASIDTTFATAATGDAYLALTQNSDAQGAATLDNLVVDDLGPAPAADAGNALSTLTVTPAQWASGTTTSATVSLTNHSAEPMTGLDLSLTSPNGWAIKPTSKPASTVAAGATTTATYAVAVPTTALAGHNVLTAHADYTWHRQRTGATSSINAAITYSSVAAAYNNVGITDNANTKAGDFDGSGNSFSAQALATAGATPGATVTHDGVDFTWPDVPAGAPDNISAQGQTVLLHGAGQIAVLGASAGTGYGTATLTYTDGSTSSAQIGLPNWCCSDVHAHGAQPTIDSVGDNGPGGPANAGTHYDIAYNTIPTDQGKTVAAVTLPNDPALHIFAMTLKPLVTAPPTADVYASDLEWTGSTNGWGPVERDHSNGEDLAGDGNALTLGGTVYAKGLGTVPVSDIPGTIDYDLGGNCTSLTAVIGLDDEETGTGGSVNFMVVADGRTVFSSAVFRSGTPAQSITVPLTGAQQVELQTGDGGDGIGNDHADWADAQFHCS